MLLLTDGTVIAQSGDDGLHWFKLTPDAHGSYVNGTWTTPAPMSFPRIYFSYQCPARRESVAVGRRVYRTVLRPEYRAFR